MVTRFVPRETQEDLAFERLGLPPGELTDRYFDGVPLPRTIRPRAWIPEGTIHKERILSEWIDSTRYFVGPQNCVVRDDNRRVTWAAVVETAPGARPRHRLVLHKIPGSWPSSTPPPPRKSDLVVEDDVWRYHIALDKYSGGITTSWITRSNGHHRLWFAGVPVETSAQEPDFPFFAFSQPPIGHVATEEPPFGMLGYKCRKTGRLFVRRAVGNTLEPEVELQMGEVLGGVTFAISRDNVLARVDMLSRGEETAITPGLLTSTDSGRTFSDVQAIDVTQYERGFKAVPGYQESTVDVGGNFHAPIHVSDGERSVALNYVVKEDTLVEAIRADGSSLVSDRARDNRAISQGGQEVFPATLGNPDPYGNGITDGHGLIMVLSVEGRLFSSNSSAGGLYYPEKALLNYEMPLVHTYASSECYTSGVKPNYVSMDYVYIEADGVGEPVSSDLHFETWDMPLPVPQVVATSDAGRVDVRIVADADMEPGQVTFSFSDPSIRVTDVKFTGLRTAELETNAMDLRGKTLRLDVDSLFHRHYAEAVVDFPASSDSAEGVGAYK